VLSVIQKTIIFLIGIGTCAPVFADWGVAFGSGQGIQGITPYRLSASWDFGPIWQSEGEWGIHAVWESSFAVWNGSRRPGLAPDRATSLNPTTSGPLFRWQRQTPFSITRIIPYAELGVGLSWLSETEIQGRIVSLHFQFEDKAGIGMRFGKKQQYDIAIRAYHYSNASIKHPNSGVDLVMMNFGLWILQ